MDISSIGMQHLNGSYIPLSHNPHASGGLNTPSNNFAEILRKASASNAEVSQAETPQVQSASLGKTPIDKNDKLYEMCMELETFLIKNLIKSMRSTVQKSELIQTGFAGGIYEDMLYDEYAKEYAKSANFGFAEMAYRELAGK